MSISVYWDRRRFLYAAYILLVFSLSLANLALAGERSDITLAKKLMNEGLYEIAYDEFIDFATQNSDSPDAAEAYYLAYDCLFLNGKYNGSYNHFKKYIRDFPLEIYTLFARERIGEIYLKLENYGSAEKTFVEFLKTYPQNEKAEDALFWLGETYYRKKEYKKAQYYYKLCLEKYPGGKFYDYALFSLGSSFRDEKNYDEAERFYRTLIDSFPKSNLTEDAYLTIGEMKADNGEFDEALTVFDNYRKVQPNGKLYDRSLLLTGRVFRKKGKSALAVKAFSQLVKNFPYSQYKNPALYYIAWTYFEKRDYANAINYFGSVDEKSKLYFPSYYWSAIALERQGNKKKAVGRFQELASMGTAGDLRNDAIYELARIGYESKQIEKADNYVSSLENTDRKWKALLLKGNSLFALERYEEAIRIFEKIVSEETDGVRKDAIYRLASSLYQIKNYRDAEEYYNVYLTNYPDGENRKQAMLLFAESAYKQEKWKDALARYRSVEQQFPETKEAKLALMGEGWALSKLGRDKEAYTILKKVKSLKGEKEDWLTLGNAAYNAGKFNEAITNYRKASKEKLIREIGLLKLGNTYTRVKRYKDAIESYDALIKDFPLGDLADDAYFKKGEVSRELKDYKVSSDIMKKMRKLYPGSEYVMKSYLISGDNFFDNEEFENAQISYQKVIDMLNLPVDTFAFIPINGIMKSVRRKDGEKRAAEFVNTYIERFKGTYLSEKLKMLKADMYYYAGKMEDAEREYSNVMNSRLKPKAMYYEAKCLNSLGKNETAEDRLRKMLEAFPDSRSASQAALFLGRILFEQKKYSESLKFLEKHKGLKTDEDFEIAMIRGEVYLKLNYKEKAVEAFKTIVDNSSGKWKGKALLYLGSIMYQDHKLDEALSLYEEAVKTGESGVISEAYYMKGMILEKQGKVKEALKTFLKVKYNLPDSPFVTKAIFAAAGVALKTGKTQDALSLYREVIERNDDKTLTIQAKDRLKVINP